MKKALSYLVLFAYGTIMLMPVLPYVSDKVAHTFWLYEHISKVHYENGKYHTHFESVEISKKAGADKAADVSKPIVFAAEHFISIETYNFFSPTIQQQHFAAFLFQLPADYQLNAYPPPKA